MAVQYKITTTAQKVNELDTLQLILTFTPSVAIVTIFENWNAEDVGVRVDNWGELEWSYDLEGATLVPGTLQMRLFDDNGELDKLFFSTTGNYFWINRRAKVELKLNNVLEYSGYIQEDSVNYDVASKSVTFRTDPFIELINKKKLFDDQNTPTNPFGYSLNSYKTIKTLLQDIFRLASSTITAGSNLSINQNWKFLGRSAFTKYQILDITFEELWQQVNELYFDTTKNLSNVGDVLRKLAIDWCCFAGMITADKAFFHKLFFFDSTNTQTLGNVLQFKKQCKSSLLDYVRIDAGGQGGVVYTKGEQSDFEERNLIRKVLPIFYVHPMTGQNGGSNVVAYVLERQNILGFKLDTGTYNLNISDVYQINGVNYVVKTWWTPSSNYLQMVTMARINSSTDPPSSGTLTKVSGNGSNTLNFTDVSDLNGDTFFVYQVRDNCGIVENVLQDSGKLQSEFWFASRGNINKCRIDFFVIDGLNYDYLKNFIYKTGKYQIIRMKKNLNNSTTDIEAIYLGQEITSVEVIDEVQH